MEKKLTPRFAAAAGIVLLAWGCPLFGTRERLWGPALDLAVEGDRAYVCAGRSLLVLDIGDPRSPARIGQVDFPDVVTGVERMGQFTVVSVTGRGDAVYDLSDPGHPVETAEKPPVPARAKKTGEFFEPPYFYVNDACVFYVLSGPLPATSSPRSQAPSQAIAGTSPPPSEVVIGQAVLDAARAVRARSPVFVRPPLAFAVSRPHLYDFELAVIDVSRPEGPLCLGRVPLKKGAHSFPRTVAAADGYAFVAATYGGVLIIDVSVSERPRIAAIFRTSSQD